VTPVKDQGSCGSCWSFGATGALEGQYYLANGELLSFSEQQQVDCNRLCFGCDGGTAESAFIYWKRFNAPILENDYPYTGVKGSCENSEHETVGSVSGYVSTTQYSESSLKNAVGTVGPVTIAIDASLWSFQLYSSGIYDPSGCSSTSLDHQVLAVGYDNDADGDYWIVKNSWGESWGINGYIWIARNDNNKCGVASDGSYPTL
jgi:cathepsin L